MTKWFKLDNAAKIYPPVLNKNWSPLFRLSVDMTEDVDPDILSEAQKVTLIRFPSFSTTLKRGFFWYYLEQIEGAPPVRPDVDNPLQKLVFHKNNGFMYRLLYYKNRIAVEFFHSLTDGTGGLTFLLSLVSEYVRLKYGENIPADKFILNMDDEPSEEELEDAFLRYSDRKTIGILEPFSYQYPSTFVPFDRLLITTGSVDSDKLRALAREKNCTVGVFTTALLLYSILQIQKKDKRPFVKRKMVKISMPVNLRNFFPSKTLRNFAAFINPGLYGMLGDYTLDEVIEFTRHYLAMNLTEKQLKARFSYNVAAEKNPIIRIIPLFLKVPILQISYYLLGDMQYCSTISNLGLVNIPEQLRKYITRMDFLLGRAIFKRSFLGVIAYNGKTVFNFTRTRLESDVEQIFFSTLVDLGLEVFIESNGRL